MSVLQFKKLSGGIYPHLFYVGDFFYPAEAADVEELKTQAETPAADFLRKVSEKMGYTQYLKGAIDQKISETQDPQGLATALKEQLKTLGK